MKKFPIIDQILLSLIAIGAITIASILIFRQDIKVPDFISTGVVLFGIQAIINYILNKRIENYKHDINEKAQKSNHDLTLKLQDSNHGLSIKLEEFKTDLSLIFAKQSKLHENRLVVISDLYGKIVDLHQKMTELTIRFKIVPADKEMADKQELERIHLTGSSYNDFLIFYLKNKIYLSTETCEKIDSIQKHYSIVFYDYTIDKRLGMPPDRESFNKIYKTFDTVNEVITPILGQIADDFRELLGVK